MRNLFWAVFVSWLSCAALAEGYLRTTNDSSGGKTLEIAVKGFTSLEQTNLTIWLVGVAHVGAEAYYATLQSFLDGCDLVLYEGVGGDREEFRKPEQRSTHGELQARFAAAMGLAFQLDAINYDRDHFMNSDVSMEALMALFGAQEDAAAEEEMEEMLATMTAASVAGQVASAGLDWVRQSPNLAVGLRYLMVEVMGNLRGDVSMLRGLPPETRTLMEILLKRRNDFVLRDLRVILQQPTEADNVAVFYGAAHMHDLESRLKESHPLRHRETRWLPVMDANLKTSSLSVVERTAIRWFVREQVSALKRMQVQENGAGEEEKEEKEAQENKTAE